MFSSNSISEKEIPAYIETPVGLLTPSGNWFHTSEKRLEQYAGELLKEHPISSQIKKSETWIRSTDIVGIILTMATMLTLPAAISLVVIILGMYLWHTNRPAFVNLTLIKLLQFTGNDFVLMMLAVIPLSWMGIQEMYTNMVLALFLFLSFKFGWIRSLFDKMENRRNNVPMNDRILNMVLIRHAIQEGMTMPSIEQMEKDIVKAMEKSAKQRKF